jgi:hypothetical protein
MRCVQPARVTTRREGPTIVKSPISEVWSRANRIMTDLEAWILRNDGKTKRIRLGALDQVRLLRLGVWSERYAVTITEVLDTVMPVLRGQVRGEQRERWGLGISVRALTSRGTERILREEIEKKYPGGENWGYRRGQLRDRQLEREQAEDAEGVVVRESGVKTVLECDTTGEFVAQYEQGVRRKQTEFRRASREAWRSERSYRATPGMGNPWR